MLKCWNKKDHGYTKSILLRINKLIHVQAIRIVCQQMNVYIVEFLKCIATLNVILTYNIEKTLIVAMLLTAVWLYFYFTYLAADRSMRQLWRDSVLKFDSSSFLQVSAFFIHLSPKSSQWLSLLLIFFIFIMNKFVFHFLRFILFVLIFDIFSITRIYKNKYNKV